MLIAMLVAVSAALSGCAAIRYEPTSYDSPKPPLKDMPGCLSKGAPNPGDECLALVRADQWWSVTGVKVQKDAAYRLTIPPHQVWFDKGRTNTPPYGEVGNSAMKLFDRYKRQEGLWFSLIAAVVEPGSNLDRKELQSVDIGSAANKDCKSVIFIASEKGDLTLYPNDARGPDGHSTYFYENNSGQIWVQVRQITNTEGAVAIKGPVAAECTPPSNTTVAR
ncbi:MAG: hypothetical protein V4706_00650 [Pseudomonadota bacterium]